MDVFNSTVRTKSEDNRESGFTLIEVIIVLAIGGILFSMAIPAFGAIMMRQRMAVGVDSLFTDLQLSRSEAITRSQSVFICRSHDAQNCTTNGAWDIGWIVFVDTNSNNQRETKEQIIYVQQAMNNGISVQFGSLNSTGIRFKPDGTGTFNGTFTFCDSSGKVEPRAIIFYYSGRPRYATTRSDGSALICS